MPGILREREATKESEYSKSDDFKKLSVLMAQILSFQLHIYAKIGRFSNAFTPRTNYFEEMTLLR